MEVNDEARKDSMIEHMRYCSRGLAISVAALREMGVEYPMRLLDSPEPSNVHQLKLAEPETDDVA